MPHHTDRRQFLKTTAAAGIGYWIAGGARAAESGSPNEQIGMASVGIGGKGSSDSADAGRSGRMVAICDVDDKRLGGAAKKFPGAKVYNDFRKMLDEMGKSIDAVTVSTPDHTHAPAALMAMRMGKHAFVQKPLTHSVYEARLMGKVARQMKVATQMGNQGTASDGLRRGAALMRAGGLGPVAEVHTWTNRPIWPQGGARPESTPPPEFLHWDLWIGAAPYRDYHANLHPFAWRGWWDFGTGALGDMACHTMNLPFMGLDLRDPISVQAVCSGHNRDSFPKWSIITYEFAATDSRPACKMVWYDGGKRPDKELLGGRQPEATGSLMIGTKETLLANGNGSRIELLSGNEIDVEFDKSPGHFQEFVDAIRGGKPAVSNFPDYASPLAETVLLGNLALWVANEGEGPEVEWDAENMKVKNLDDLEPLVKPTYREGYVLDA